MGSVACSCLLYARLISCEIRWSEIAASTMADVEDVDLFLVFPHTVDDTINVRLAAVEQVSEPRIFSGWRASIGQVLEGESCIQEPVVPVQCSFGMLGADVPEQDCKVAFCPWSDPNDICHARLQTRRKIL